MFIIKRHKVLSQENKQKISHNKTKNFRGEKNQRKLTKIIERGLRSSAKIVELFKDRL